MLDEQPMLFHHPHLELFWKKRLFLYISFCIAALFLCYIVYSLYSSTGIVCLPSANLMATSMTIGTNGDLLVAGNNVAPPSLCGIRLFGITNHKAKWFIAPLPGSIRSISLNLSEGVLFTTGDIGRFWDANSGDLLKTIQGADLCTSDGVAIIASSFGNRISFINWKGNPIYPPIDLPTEKTELTAMAMSKDGSTLLYGDNKGNIGIIDVIANKVVRNIKAHIEGDTKVCWCSNSKNYVSGGRDGLIAYWTIDQDSPVILRRTSGAIHSISVDGDRYLATAHADGNITLWDYSTLTIVAKYYYFGDSVQCSLFSDSFLYCGFQGGSVIRYRLPSRE